MTIVAYGLIGAICGVLVLLLVHVIHHHGWCAGFDRASEIFTEETSSAAE